MPRRTHLVATSVALLLSTAAAAHADVELSLRAGGSAVDLGASSEVPIVGSRLDDAVAAYNGAAMAYNAAHGYGASSPDAAPLSSQGDVGFAANLLVLTPALDVAAGAMRARLELPIGLGDDLRTIGFGAYPIGVAFARERAAAVPFVLAGGAFSHVADGDRAGALFEVRLVGGVRLARRLSVELGVRPYVVGGAIDRQRLDTLMETYDPRGPDAPPPPAEVVRGGVGQAFDLTVGVSL